MGKKQQKKDELAKKKKRSEEKSKKKAEKIPKSDPKNEDKSESENEEPKVNEVRDQIRLFFYGSFLIWKEILSILYTGEFWQYLFNLSEFFKRRVFSFKSPWYLK